MNNSESIIRAGYTPNQLFLGESAEPKGHNIEDKNLFFINKGKIKKSRNFDETLRDVKKLRNALNEKLELAYRFTVKERKRIRDIYNKQKKTLNWQFQVGEWVLVSKGNTLRERNKTKPVWIDPFMVMEQLSDKVYMLQDILKNKKEVHTSRMRYYDEKDYVPDKNIKELFLLSKGELAVKKFSKIIKSKGELYILTSWKGFDEIDEWFI